jgi:phosphatidylserine/phosphatidylglycerophosphate/cardiolipin synthase-like enzyme
VKIRILLILALLLPLLGSCNAFSDAELEDLGKPKVTAYFNSTGTREGNQRDIGAEKVMVERIASATGTLDACIYGFSNQNIIDAVIRAHYRGVRVRVVGDARHFAYNERGYKQLQENHIPIVVGNQFHIMHNKFFVIDGLFVFVGTGNITRTGFNRNNNNWILIDSPFIAKDFLDEFEQMYGGKFSTAKDRIENGNTYTVGDTEVEVYFSPQEDAMGRILEELDAAHTNIHFTLFAFTKDQIGSRFIQKHREFSALNEAEGIGSDTPILERPKRVTGIVDRSQVHGNFLYHEVYRLTMSGVPMKMDANEASYLPGDYQAGGGRLHSKTMIVDYGTPDARVLTGSFNWSSSATIANDEVMLILRGERITEEYYREFQNLWWNSKHLSDAVCNYAEGYNPHQETGPKCARDVEPGDVLISEVGWYGWNGLIDGTDRSGQFRDLVANDEFIELYNTTDDPINLSLWTISNGNDFSVGFTMGTIIQPGQYFLVLDHNLDVFSDSEPQRAVQAYTNGDFVMNLANDPRFPRLNVKDVALDLHLVDTLGRDIDVAGNGGPPFAGGPEFDQNSDIVRVRSMERDVTQKDGTRASAWDDCALSEGGANVNEEFRADVIASPGEPNSN